MIQVAQDRPLDRRPRQPASNPRDCVQRGLGTPFAPGFGMNTLPLTERRLVLNLVGALLWSSFRPNRKTLRHVARELDLDGDEVFFELLDLPPKPEDIDPCGFSPRVLHLAETLMTPIVRSAPSHAAYEVFELLQRLSQEAQTSRSTPSQGFAKSSVKAAA